jgi:small subunit ribosomal protein S15
MFTKEEKTQVIKDFQLSDQDTGSDIVQIALLSQRIEVMQKHMEINKKDYSSKRGLIRMVEDRRNFIKRLSKRDVTLYKATIKRLGLRK